MPELPEVETIRKGLERKIIGLKVSNVEILNPGSFEGDTSQVVSQTITSVWRRAKVLGIALSNGNNLLFHLKMSGQIIFVHGKERVLGGHPTEDMVEQMPNRSTRVIFHFSDGSTMFFNDQRKFGWVKVIPQEQVESEKFLSSLGPEPFSSDYNLTVLKNNLLKHKKTPVKVAIMDQTVVAGVGNIYASEALFLAKIAPNRLVGTLTEDEFKKLYEAIKESLSLGLKHGGSTRSHFVDAEGKQGKFLDYAYVYNRAGQSCQLCQALIVKSELGGRGTYFCKSCQK